jgi:PAS domain S-box-containing protein
MARVLIVDDERSVGRTLGEFLRSDGHDVTAVEDADAALECLQETAFDVAVVDIILPGLDGVELLQRIRTLAPSTQVAMMTAEPSLDTARAALRAGASDYLIKPINRAAILRVVATAVKFKALDDAKRRLEAENHAHQENLQRLVAERTEQLRVSEAEARELSRFNQAVLDALTAHLCVLAEDGTVLSVNRVWEDFRVTNPPLAMGAGVGGNYLTTCEAVTGADAAVAQSVVRGLRAVAQGELPEFLLEYPCHSPVAQRWFLLRATRFAGAGPARLVVAHANITERKRAEEALRESEEKYRGIFDDSVAAIFVFDRGKNFVNANQAGLDLLGYSREELMHMSIPDVDADQAVVLPAHGELLSGGRLINYEHSLRRKDGTCITVLNNSIPLTDADGNVTGMLSTLFDITARKRAEAEHERLQAQLSQAQKMESVGRLAGGVAHDTNNLLTGIMSYVELSRDRLEPDHPVRAFLDEITQDAQRSASITRQLLAFARKQTIAPRILDLNAAVSGTLKMLTRLLGEDIDLTWQPGAALWAVKMDPSQLDQILANLTVNARDAIGGVGKLTLETRNTNVDQASCADLADAVPGDYVMLAVSDTGCGMGKDVLKHLFEPFYTTKGVGEGSGLGLAMVYGIVRQNHGFIAVHSKPGRGTTFRIYLPRSAAEAAPAAVAVPPSARRGGNETILLVEDEKSIRVTARLFLEALGYTVLAAADPEEALRLAAAAGEIHLLITDVIMPGLSGRDLAQRLTALRPALRCLFMSGYTADTIAARGILDEGMYFLAKPFTRNNLAAKVRDVLESSTSAAPAAALGPSR